MYVELDSTGRSASRSSAVRSWASVTVRATFSPLAKVQVGLDGILEILVTATLAKRLAQAPQGAALLIAASVVRLACSGPRPHTARLRGVVALVVRTACAEAEQAGEAAAVAVTRHQKPVASLAELYLRISPKWTLLLALDATSS